MKNNNLTCGLLFTCYLECWIPNPICSVSKLPVPFHILDAGVLRAVGESTTEFADLGADHPETAGSTTHVEKVFGLVLPQKSCTLKKRAKSWLNITTSNLMKVNWALKERVHSLVQPHPCTLGNVGRSSGFNANGCTAILVDI